MDSTSPFQPWASDESAKNVKTEREVVDDAKLHRENVNHPKHRQTASYNKESVGAPSSAPGTSSAAGPGAEPARAAEPTMDPSKVASMHQIVENTLSQDGRQRVSQLLDAVEGLSGAERLLLYLKLPTGVPQHDPLKQPINPLGSRAELQQTVTWIQTHLEVDPDVSLPKQDVYDEYIAHCMSSNMKPLSTADFGKVMKQVYPTVRPRRLGTRGNSRYCYAGLRKKIKLEVPQLPNLGESSTEPIVASRETERVICDWAESKLGIKFANILELSQHLVSSPQRAPPGPASASPPPLSQPHAPVEDATNQQLALKIKRKIQAQGTPGRPKKNKGQEMAAESPPSTSYAPHLPPLKHEAVAPPEPAYGYQPPYVPVYDVRPPFNPYGHPPRAHPPAPHHSHDYRPESYAFEPYPRDLTRPETHNLPINLSSDASLDLSTERSDWQRRRPPEPPPATARLPLPGKKLILETYQSETRAASPRVPPAPERAPEEPPSYLPKKMRAAEILGGKLAAARALANPPADAEPPARPDFLEDPKNLMSRSKSTAAALARERQEAAGERRCALAGAVICAERHSEILNRERVISICNIDKHDLDDYLNEGSSQEHEEELLQYFHQRTAQPPAAQPPAALPPAALPPTGAAQPPAVPAPTQHTACTFLETSQDPHDDHSQGKNEKISQLRELLAKNLKNQSGSGSQPSQNDQEPSLSHQNSIEEPEASATEGAFKPLAASGEDVKAPMIPNQPDAIFENCNSIPTQNGTHMNYITEVTPNHIGPAVAGPHLYNGHCHEPQSPTTRTQQYDFVPISDGCHSPGNFHSKSPLGFGQRSQSPTKANKPVIMGGSLQTSPISHSTAASPFVSPRNTPVPRSRFCPRPIPKLNGRKRRNPLSLGVSEPCPKQFAIPNDQKFMSKMNMIAASKYCQPISAPPSPNIINLYPCTSVTSNGSNNCLKFLPHAPFREHMNGDQPLSADPLSSEVSQFFQESMASYRPTPDSFRSQSVPLKQGMSNINVLSYNNTPVGSVPPTPVPNEFCDFGSLADTCDISKAGLNRETLNKIYDAIDSSNDVLAASGTQSIINSNETLTNGCDPLPEHPILSDEQLSSIIPSGDDLLERSDHFNQTFGNETAASENVDEFLKRANSMEFGLSELDTEKNKYYTSRSVPSTPVPYKRAAPNLQIDSRRSRALFAADAGYSNVANGISSKSVPSTPQFTEERNMFSYSNGDFLINGNSVCGTTQLHDSVVDSEQGLASPLQVMLQEEILEPLTPALLADLDKMDGPPYVDL